MSPKMITSLMVLVVLLVLLTVSCSSLERKLLFYPTHRPPDVVLTPWLNNGQVIGFARVVESPKNVWLMVHGNGGQAADREYALPRFSPADAVYILEYPGYGNREGTPSAEAFNRAAEEAYRQLRTANPTLPVCVAAESIGSGPAAWLTRLDRPPDKLVLVVPFDRLSLVAKDHYPGWLVGMLLSNDWDNVATLAKYRGPVDIFGAKDDEVIPVAHAKALAAAVPQAKFTLINGGHNDWAGQSAVTFRNP